MPNSLPSPFASLQPSRPSPSAFDSVTHSASTSTSLITAHITQVTSSATPLDLSRHGPHWPRQQPSYVPYRITHNMSLHKKAVSEGYRQPGTPAQGSTSHAVSTAGNASMIPLKPDCRPGSSDSMTVAMSGESEPTAERICAIASRMHGNDTLSALQMIERHWHFLCNDIQLSDQQICAIFKNKSGPNSLEILTKYWPFLSAPKIGFNKDQVFNIVKRAYGDSALEALAKQWDFLSAPEVGLTHEQIYQIAKISDGANVLNTLRSVWWDLRKKINLSEQQIFMIAKSSMANQKLQLLSAFGDMLTREYSQLNTNNIYNIAMSHHGVNLLIEMVRP